MSNALRVAGSTLSRFSCGCCSCGGQGLFRLLQLRKGPRCKRRCRPSKWNRDLTGRGYNSIKAAASLPTFHKKHPPTEGSVSTTPCGGKSNTHGSTSRTAPASTAVQLHAHGSFRTMAAICGREMCCDLFGPGYYDQLRNASPTTATWQPAVVLRSSVLATLLGSLLPSIVYIII